MSRIGLEPTTYRLKAGCSTIKLPRQKRVERDLNSCRINQRIYSPPLLTTQAPPLNKYILTYYLYYVNNFSNILLLNIYKNILILLYNLHKKLTHIQFYNLKLLNAISFVLREYFKLKEVIP